MKQNKLLLCLLSTTLMVPSFSTTNVHAESNHSSKTVSEQEQTQKNDSKPSPQSKQDTSNKSSDKDTTKENDDDALAKSKDSTQKDDALDKEEKNSKKSSPQTEQSNKDAVNNMKGNYESNRSIFNILGQNTREDNTKAPSLWDSLFSHDVTLPDITEKDTNQDDQNKSTQDNQETAKSTHNNEQQTTDDAQQSSQSNPTQDDTSQSNESNNISDKIDELESDDNLSSTNNDQESAHSTDNQQQDESVKNRDTTTDSEDAKSENKADSSKSSDDALNSILDSYSEDVKKTKNDYDASKNSKNKDAQPSATTHSDDNENADNETQNNTQLPTDKELATKQAPSQSFEDNTTKNNTRATTLFQTMPNLNDDTGNSSDFTVVENKNIRDFIKSLAKDAHDIGQKENVYASVMIAQAILESDSGKSQLAQEPNNNLFGMKGNYQGKSSTFNTLEASGNDSMYQISAQFRSYPSTKESLEDYADLIKNGIDGDADIYKPTWKNVAPTYKSATSHLATTYATDPNYADKLNSLIKHYDLTQFDKKEMPNLDNYTAHDTSQDTSGEAFKTFAETMGDSPYPHGQCTWYVYNRMAQFDKHISGDLGDARNWNNRAEIKGYQVGSKPVKHSAVVYEAGQQGVDQKYGHVAFVEKVNSDGSIVVSESNVKGLGIISFRTIDADDASQLSYIQGKKQ